ncbi:MAG TPA: oligosaccharide flippase family protein [Thermoleophilaceae bacterium]|jgi:PST family polysaccharide transporter
MTEEAQGAGAGRNTLLALMTQLVTGLFTAVLTIYLVRALGPREFGVLSLAIGIGTVLLLPSDFGISGSASRFIAERFPDRPAIAAIMADALRLKLAIGAIVSIALLATAGLIADAYGEPELGWPIRWMAIAVFGQSMVGFFRYAFLSMRDAGTGFRIVAGESAVEAAATIGLVVLAGGAASAAAGRAIGYTFGAILAGSLAARLLGRAAFSRSRRLADARRRLARYAGALFAIDVAFSASVQMAPLMIGGFLGAREVGLFTAPSRLMILLQYPGLALANGVGPRMARGEDHEPETRLFTTAFRYLIVLQALLLVPIVAWADPIVDLLLGSEFSESADLLRQLTPYIFSSGLAAILASGLTYLGEAKRRLPIAIGDVFLTAGLTAGGLATIGLSGAAYAADIVSVLYVGVHFWIIRGLVDLPLRPLLLALVRGLLAAAAAAGVLVLFGTDDLAVWEWVAGGAGALLAFTAVVVLTREVSLGELRSMVALVARRSRA